MYATVPSFSAAQTPARRKVPYSVRSPIQLSIRSLHIIRNREALKEESRTRTPAPNRRSWRAASSAPRSPLPSCSRRRRHTSASKKGVRLSLVHPLPHTKIRLALKIHYIYLTLVCSEQGVRLAQQMQVGPCMPVGIHLEKAEVGPTSGPTWRLSHFRLEEPRQAPAGVRLVGRLGRPEHQQHLDRGDGLQPVELVPGGDNSRSARGANRR